MATVKQYNIAGVGATVELGKGGPKIDNKGTKIALINSSSVELNAAIAEGTDSAHAVTKSQLESATNLKIRSSTTTVNYNDGNVSLGTIPANGYVHYVIVDPGTAWADTTVDTNITVGDAADNDRLFANFDPEVQSKDETDYKYSTPTELFAYVTQATASSGTAKVTVWYSASGDIA